MKRYRTLTIHCENESEAIRVLKTINESCNFEPFLAERLSAIPTNYMYKDDITLRITVMGAGLSPAIMILGISGVSDVKVFNIIPFDKSVFGIKKDEYNVILETFKELVIDRFIKGFVIDFPPAEYTMESLIPNSYPKLIKWVKSTANPVSPLDHECFLNLWFDFINTLVINQENKNFSPSDLAQWLEEQNFEKFKTLETVAVFRHDMEFYNYFDGILQN